MNLGLNVMDFFEELERIPKPTLYQRQGKECYLDPYREKLIPATPEETVRQKVLIWLENELNVPHDVILVEMLLSKCGLNSKDRADIVISRFGEEGLLYPVAIVECKANTVQISNNTIEQCCRYTDALGIDYAFVTNGVEMLAFHYNEKDDQYIQLAAVPTYQQMLDGKTNDYVPMEPPKRLSMSEMQQPEYQQSYIDSYIIGGESTPNVIAHCINLFDGLVDMDRTLSRPGGDLFSVEKDLGVRVSSYGNASGYDYVAPYRCFLVKDNNGNHQIVSLGLNNYGNNKTILCVAIDDFKKSHHSLQLLVDTFMIRRGKKLVFTHNGKIAVGHSGSAPVMGLISKIVTKLPHLYQNERIVLGAVDADKLMMLDAPDMTELVINLIDYALLRDEYRAEVTKAGKP